MRPIPSALLILPLLINSIYAQANSNLNGQSGLVQMPDARIEQDGLWRTGINYQSPYSAFWSSISLLPWLETSARFTRIDHVEGFAGNKDYGKYGDKAFSVKALLNPESSYLPAIAAGIDDFHGTSLFRAPFITASKRFGPLDATLGFGKKRIDGLFGGLRYSNLLLQDLNLVAEYDSNLYQNDHAAEQSGVAKRKKGLNIGLEYQWGWLKGQAARLSDGTPSINLALNVPLNRKEFIPKLDEPASITALPPRPTLAQWQEEPDYRRNLLRALGRHDFRDIRFSLSGDTLRLNLSNTRLSKPSRAAGHAAQLALAHSPFGTRQIEITLEQGGLPMLSYIFTDAFVLSNYFNGSLSREALAKTVEVRYAKTSDQVVNDEAQALLADLDELKFTTSFAPGEGNGEIGQFVVQGANLSKFRIAPKLGFFFNDPSGVMKYDLYLQGSTSARLAKQTFFDASVTGSVLENVSSVSQDSNSALPHVRSDVAQYKRDGKITLDRFALSQYFHLGQGLYGRASAGLYEEMFGGAGGQILYQPKASPFSVDLAVDSLRQRDTEGGFKFRDYRTTTALASVHYRIPSQGLTATLRAGRFLARDEGARFELSRRFGSGVEIGTWYTVTNGNDITSPGTPEKPYRDKGIFMSIPLNIMLTKDTPIIGSYSLAPWTRDVGQTVAYPGDLYGFASRFLQNREDGDGLREFGDLNDDYRINPPQSLFFQRPVNDYARLLKSSFADSLSGSGLRKLGLASGVILLSSQLDKRSDKKSQTPPTERQKKLIDVGNALPWASLAMAGALSTYEGDNRLSRTAYSALQAGATAGTFAEIGKWAFGRARPRSEQGNHDFSSGSRRDKQHSFPSSHVAVSAAVITPFAAEYDMPVLYAIPALTSYARMREREHWFSDVMAANLLGAAVGQYTWQWNRKRSKYQPSVQIGTRSLTLNWETQ